MRKNILLAIVLVVFGMGLVWPATAWAQIRHLASPTPAPTATSEESVRPPSEEASARVDITQKSEESLGPLEKLLRDQKLGVVWPINPVKYAIRGAVAAGVPANTIVLLLLLPIVAFVIAFTRNIIGIRGFGIFLPAAMSVVFVATGPLVGVGLFLVIVTVSTAVRMLLRKLGIKLQYLPRMAFILWAVVIGVLSILFVAPLIKFPDFSNISIFAVLVLVLLAEDFIRVQLGKSVKTAVGLTFETLILALISFLFLTLEPLRGYVFLNPEISLLGTAVADLLLGKYTGLRVMEFYRFRKLINGK